MGSVFFHIWLRGWEAWLTYVKPKPNHPWNNAINSMVRIANLRKEIAELRELIKTKESEIAALKARSKDRP